MRIDANRADWLQLTRTKVENIFSSHVCNLFHPLASKAAKKQTKLFTKKKNAMLDFLMVPLVVGIICAGIYGLFELFVRRKERLAIIEKIGEKLDASAFEGKLRLPSYGIPLRSFSSLKGGCLLAGIGLGLLVGFLLHLVIASAQMNNDNELYRQWDMVAVGYGASVLLFGGIGLLISFLIETRMQQRDKQKE